MENKLADLAVLGCGGVARVAGRRSGWHGFSRVCWPFSGEAAWQLLAETSSRSEVTPRRGGTGVLTRVRWPFSSDL